MCAYQHTFVLCWSWIQISTYTYKKIIVIEHMAKIQDLGLAATYQKWENIPNFVGMLDGLAFLPVNEVSDGLRIVRGNVPALPNNGRG